MHCMRHFGYCVFQISELSFFSVKGRNRQRRGKNICEMLKGFILSFPTVLIIGL